MSSSSSWSFSSSKTTRTMCPHTDKDQVIPSFANAGKFVKPEVHRRLVHLVAPHVDSFDYFLDMGLQDAVKDIPPMEMLLGEDLAIKMQFLQPDVGFPSKREDLAAVARVTPREARERAISYTGAMEASVSIHVPSLQAEAFSIRVRLGDLPIMVMSNRCSLKGKSQQALVDLREEANECGGYFVINGIERVIRLLQVPRRNHASAIERNSYKNRGPAYSDKGVAMRCVRADQSSVTITLHYLNNGGATLKFVLRKQEFLLPVVIVAKALADISDKEIFDRVVQGDLDNTFLTTRLELLLRDAKQYHIYTKHQCQAFLGSLFRAFLPISTDTSDVQAGEMLINRYLFVHAVKMGDKLECLLHMLKKLFAFAQGKCAADNADALMNHELLLPGHLVTMIVKEKIEETLLNVRMAIQKEYSLNKTKVLAEINSVKFFQRHFDRMASSIGQKVGSFLSTGNITSSTGLDLMQVSGYTIVAERLNIFRYMSHFQSVHRGQFFTTMKTTAVRKLLPESWGFLCPVHTPDGSPCGLLNHLAREAVIVAFPTAEQMPTTPLGKLTPAAPASSSRNSSIGGNDTSSSSSKFLALEGLKRLLAALGMVPSGTGGGDGELILPKSHLPVLIDGIVVGGVPATEMSALVAKLRSLKANGSADKKCRIDPTTELAHLPRPVDEIQLGGAAYPGLYIFTQPGRMIRPVLHLASKRTEWIGPMEQVHMDIACLSDDVRQETTHVEISPSAMLSHIASLTPFSDYNQSPRNMYQCQMGKQTMGTPAHALRHRADNKLYRIQNTQAPLVQTQTHRDYGMDEYPQGANAVVAVIAFTGYDMEDAMIINKSSFERGFGHGVMYKTTEIDLDEEEKRGNKAGGRVSYVFSNIKKAAVPARSIGSDEDDDDDDDDDEEDDDEDDDDEDAAKGKQKSKKGRANGGKVAWGGSEAEKFYEALDLDGLPFESEEIRFGDPVCCFVDEVSGTHHVIKHKESEKAFVDCVRVLGPPSTGVVGSKKVKARKVIITLRYPRKPVIGDKFSSRHGQKGTLSVLWPQQDMPFSEYGMSPDVLINPHAFPSRMTIGMLIESMAGKAGALHGHFQDATPFTFHEEARVIDYMGEQLRSAGYHYFGSEPLYNGLTGKLMHCDIFMGVVFYQRLRHMVSDKSQVRSTGPVTAITRQPVKGRKKHGGIRLGEMERDALLSHGVSFCLHDRLMMCSDAHIAHVCASCGGLLTVHAIASHAASGGGGGGMGGGGGGGGGYKAPKIQTCMACKSSEKVKPINLPYVYRYLANELAGMGIKITLGVK